MCWSKASSSEDLRAHRTIGRQRRERAGLVEHGAGVAVGQQRQEVGCLELNAGEDHGWVVEADKPGGGAVEGGDRIGLWFSDKSRAQAPLRLQNRYAERQKFLAFYLIECQPTSVEERRRSAGAQSRARTIGARSPACWQFWFTK